MVLILVAFFRTLRLRQTLWIGCLPHLSAERSHAALPQCILFDWTWYLGIARMENRSNEGLNHGRPRIGQYFCQRRFHCIGLAYFGYVPLSQYLKLSAIGLRLPLSLFWALLPALFLIYLSSQKGALSWAGEGFAKVDLSFLSFLSFIGSIAAAVQIVEMTSLCSHFTTPVCSCLLSL